MDTSRKVDSVHLASQSQDSSHPEFSHVESCTLMGSQQH